jgi:hypothetical protein
MMRRVYLFDKTRYKIRTVHGVEIFGAWSDERRVFYCRVQRGKRYVIPLSDLAALAPLGDNGTARRWVTMGDVFLGKFAPPDNGPTWVHPYRRHTSPLVNTL